MTEEGNPGNWRGVARVVARLHTPLLDEGVRLVDTPGVGSVHEHNTLATDAYLPSLDAAVLVVSADPPISKAERAFLERVVEHAVRLFVVLNKADYLAPGELERIVAFTERVVQEVAPDWPGPVYTLSARTDVGDPAALRRFRHDLERFLRGDRAATVSDSARRSGQRLLGSLRLALDLERRTATLPADELTRRRQRREQTIQRLADDTAADAALLRAAVRRALEALERASGPRRPSWSARPCTRPCRQPTPMPTLGLASCWRSCRPSGQRCWSSCAGRPSRGPAPPRSSPTAAPPSRSPTVRSAASSSCRPRRPAPSACPSPPSLRPSWTWRSRSRSVAAGTPSPATASAMAA